MTVNFEFEAETEVADEETAYSVNIALVRYGVTEKWLGKTGQAL